MPEVLLSREIGDAVSEAMIADVRNFTIGFGRAGEKPAVKGTGVLVEYKGVHGILTAAHVDAYIRELKRPIGVVRLNQGLAQQASVLDVDEVYTYAAGQDPWPTGSDDIAFIHIPPHLVGNIERRCSFLNGEKNLAKDEPEPSTALIQTHAVFGMVEDFTGATTRQGGVATTAMKGVLTPGTLTTLDGATATLECFAENIPDLPSSFGGTSGGGLWRIYVRKGDDGKYTAVHRRLIGIASREEDGKPPRIICQGVGRVGAMLGSAYRTITGKPLEGTGKTIQS
jgi:hypothetical protein